MEEAEKKKPNKICPVVRDLLPLYQDDALSKESREFIEDHLKECEECRQYFSVMEQQKAIHSSEPSDSEAAFMNPSEEETEKHIKKIASRLRSRRRKITLGIVGGLLVMFIIITQVFSYGFISGNGMEPNYASGENVIVNKLAYLLTSPKSGDVIFYRHNGGVYMKRIIGVPGDKIELTDHTLLINGEPSDIMQPSIGIEEQGDVTYPVILGEEEYFVLGDNPEGSRNDSRYHLCGNIDRDEILGKVICKSIPGILVPTGSNTNNE